ncbi:hypothetical protein GIB67_037133 [Kingdonia uniflora]|uniref:histidine kinase n=1 Tax=Kingdonia uniflora TaxID=39325 RepID=A0A7J7LHV1_9MAGN|nr:hypothetical protein GIB67_037133 [Kingdonia uniflora]
MDFQQHSQTVIIVLTTANILTAVVSYTTALMLVHIIPELLSMKSRELFLKNKAAEPDREMGIIRTQEEIGWHVRMLTHEIKSTLDKQTILKATLVELGRTLTLEEFALWMLTRTVILSHAAILKESMRARDYLAELNVSLDLARREPETAIRTGNDFLAVMNHEIRTPMHAIIALYSLLQEIELTAEQRLMVETVLKSSNLLATLINDELDLTRLEDRSLELDLRAFNLHSVFRKVIDLIKPIASVKKLFLSLNLALDLREYVVGDEKLLMQTILKVARNAVKFSKEGSISVSISVAKMVSLRDARALGFSPMPSDNHFYLRVQVKDSGSGISPQDIRKLFNKFADSQSLPSKTSCGKGLGLAISKRMATKGLFVHLGCDVTAVGSSEEYLQIFSHEHKVVFTDVGIPGMDGYEVLSVLLNRFSARHQRPLIIALTAIVDRATKDNCLRVGMDEVVLKPVSLQKMRSVLSCSC